MTHIPTSLFALCSSLALITGCANTTPQPAQDGESTASTSDRPTADPVDDSDPNAPNPDTFGADEGAWLTVKENMANDDCKMGDWVTEGAGFVVDVSADNLTDFSMQHTRGTDECTLYNDGGFACDTRTTISEKPQEKYGIDAELVMDITSTGYFDAQDMTWERHLQVTCAGPGCWMVELATSSFPCTMAIYVEAEFQ